MAGRRPQRAEEANHAERMREKRRRIREKKVRKDKRKRKYQ